jgi:hypothetical protein
MGSPWQANGETDSIHLLVLFRDFILMLGGVGKVNIVFLEMH